MTNCLTALLQGTCCLLYCNNSNWHCLVCSWAGSGYQQSAVQHWLGCTWQLRAGAAGSQWDPFHGLSLSLCLVSRGRERWETQIPSKPAAAQFDPGACIASWLRTRSTNSSSWYQHKGEDSSASQYNCAWEESEAGLHSAAQQHHHD